METKMEKQQLYDVYLKEIMNLITNKNYEKALALCAEMKQRMYAEKPVDPIMLGWQKYYTFICYIKLDRDDDALNEFLGEEPHPFVFDYIQTSFLTSVCAEIACSKGNAVLCNKLSRLAWTTSFHDKEHVMRIQKAQNACIYFEKLKQPRLNFSFARFLTGVGKSNKIPVLYVQGLECLLSNYRQSKSLTISAILINSLPDVTKLLDEKDEDLPKDRLLEYIEEVSKIPQSMTISSKFPDAKDLLLNNKLEELSKLIDEYPSLIDENDEVGMTLLLIASQTGNYPAVEMLLEKGSDVHRCETISGHSSILEAAKMGHFEIVKLLIDNGADPETRDKYGFTPLLMAVIEKQYDVLGTLLGYGVLLERRDDNFDTPLLAAIRCNNLDAVKLLISAGSDITVKTRDDKNIYQLAEETKNEEMIKVLSVLKTPSKAEVSGANNNN